MGGDIILSRVEVIYVLKDGAVCERGTHDDLVKLMPGGSRLGRAGGMGDHHGLALGDPGGVW